MFKKRLTLLFGVNAADDVKLKPYLIYFPENPRQLEIQNKVWMTKIIFENWFKNYLCPEVNKYFRNSNLSNEALLILDHAPGPPVSLSKLTDYVEIEYLPQNTTALIQQMDQCAISTFKAYYLRRTF